MEEESKLEELEEDQPFFNWYILNVLRNENKCVAQIKEHIHHRRLQDKIVDVKCFKEFLIKESEEFDPASDFLPKTGFKATPSSIWVQLPNGNYKRIQVLERNPFNGSIFIKMVYDVGLFKEIRSWDAGYFFLGGNFPVPMTEDKLNKMSEKLNSEMIDIQKYVEEKGYRVVTGKRVKPLSKDRDVFVDLDKSGAGREIIDDSKILSEEDFRKVELTPEEIMEQQKVKIYSELNIKEFGGDLAGEKIKVMSKKKGDFNVNDYVLVKHLGFKGIIQEIDYEADKIVVGVNMFGRKQPVECSIKDIQAI